MAGTNGLQPYAFVLAVRDLRRSANGMREMLIATPDGHHIMVGQPL